MKGQRFWKHREGPLKDPTFWSSECSICGDKALYRFRGKAYCRAHKQAVVMKMTEKLDEWVSRTYATVKSAEDGYVHSQR